MSDISDLRSTIVPKSDQLNSEQLMSGPINITVSDVRMGNSEQPVVLHYENDDGRPYKPCKTMRKVLIFVWGENGKNWIGRSMTLYNDPTVKFGGVEVGGIRISHLSDIESDIALALTATKGKKAMHLIKRMASTGPRLGEVIAAIKSATDKSSMDAAKAMAKQLSSSADAEAALNAYKDRVQQLKKPVGDDAPKYSELASMMVKATTDETKAEILGMASHLPPDQRAELEKLGQDAP